MNDTPYEQRTDTVKDKLRLLEAAYRSGNLDLAMALSVAIKETLSFERQLQRPKGQPILPAEHSIAVSDLPKPWATWARGWKSCKCLNLFETVGIERVNEPVDVAIATAAREVSDFEREVRVARIDSSGALAEVPSQVYGETRYGDERRARLVFLADVPAHQQTAYFIFYGNSLAERPDYATDLQVRGEGVALDIENHHFKASLSRQMGQLERLVYKRQHSLELYAGGKGHGEPPGIDWGHDYVDIGQFQKFRMRNWPACPNFEVVRGPICTRVRRWGFPYSPLHPVFTPSRVHMDQTYVFFAGLPYFIKESRFDVVKDVTIEAMRDDEWVFSGYSFSDTVWFDQQGKLHEGDVPADSAEKLWGAGFYHRTSRDAFVALWLEHVAEGFNDIHHGGVPTLNYEGHGQLWSRYPAHHAELKAGAAVRQLNAYVVFPFEANGGAEKLERLRHQLLNPLQTQPGDIPRVKAIAVSRALARAGETSETAPLKPAIWKTLAEVLDEQLYNTDANVVDMGYIYDVRERDGVVTILVTMPHRGRPEYDFLVTAGGGRIAPGIRERLLKLNGVRDVVVDFTWNPPWTVERLSDAGRRALGLPA